MKRKRGGQLGNQNARKHGLYCSPLTPDEMCVFWNILNTEDVDPEIAVLRVKVISSINRDPGNRRLLRDASKLLAKWYSAKLHLNRADANHLRKSILSAYDAALAGPNRLLTERIECTLKT